jgi:hypothetical protein
MNKPEDLKKTDEQPLAKRPYARPRLSVYGDLRLTSASSTGGMNDGGVHPNQHSG